MFSKQFKEKSAVLMFRLGVSLLVGLFVVVLGPGLLNLESSQALAHKREIYRGGCTQIARSAQQACIAEKTDDYYIATGNCQNIPDRDDRTECSWEAKAELKEALGECGDQREARNEVCENLDEDFYNPVLDPDNFKLPKQNLYFPLVPGTFWVYENVTGEGTETITVTVTYDTIVIKYPEDSDNEFTCIVVKDIVELDGEVIEDTDDWYAQDNEGNVWYFGEIARNYEDGELVDLEGSWKAGRDFAEPGIIMKTAPEEGDFYREEYFLGDAEDVAEVIDTDVDDVVVPFNPGGYDDCLNTKNSTPIEPDVEESKYYAPGVGVILEVNPDPENPERVELIDMGTL